MKSAFATRALLAALVLAAGCSAPQQEVPTATGLQSALTARPAVSGRWLVDGQGRALIFHGFNMVNKQSGYAPVDVGFDDDDASLVAAYGFNLMRIGLIYAAVEPSRGVYDDAYLTRIATTVDTLANHGVRSLLEFHQDMYGKKVSGVGFPDWATVLPSGTDPYSKCGFPLDYYMKPAIGYAFENFFWQDATFGLQAYYAAAWKHVAARFAGALGVLGYEVMNEPFIGSRWSGCVLGGDCTNFEPKKLMPFYQKVIDAIRNVDASTAVFIEPNVMFMGPYDTHLPATSDSKLVFSFHPYGKEAADTAANIGKAQAEAPANEALMATEWGAMTDLAKIRAMAEVMDQANMSWLYWTWANNAPYPMSKTVCGDQSTDLPLHADEQGVVVDPGGTLAGDNLDSDRLRELSRPYPRAVAGTPTHFSFLPDPTRPDRPRIFKLDYDVVTTTGGQVAAGLETEVFVPAHHFPNGYLVDVRGARVLSAANDPVLRLLNLTGASHVSLEVRPSP